MQTLLELPDRTIYLVSPAQGPHPAVFFIADRDAGGILVNCPAYSTRTLSKISTISPLSVLFLPSHHGQQDLALWKQQCDALTIVSSAEEADRITPNPDVTLDRKTRLTRTIGFIAMSGRTAGTCALQLRNLPGVVFFGPALEHAPDDGWPTLIEHDDDYSWENRLIGSLGLQSVSYQYAFCDNFDPAQNARFGPDAAHAIQQKLDAAHE